MIPYAADGKFPHLTKTHVDSMDDVVVGYLASYILHVPLTEDYSHLLHSHNQFVHPNDLKGLKVEELSKQVCLSYSLKSLNHKHAQTPNRMNISEKSPGVNVSFGLEEDPTRFLTIHCFLHPGTDYCQQAASRSQKQDGA